MSVLTEIRTAPVRVSARLLAPAAPAAGEERQLPAVTPADTAEASRDAGMTTAEYAVGTVAACGFGGVLYKVITSDAVLQILKAVILKAFHLSF